MEILLGYGLKVKEHNQLLLVEKEIVEEAYASTDVVHTLVEANQNDYTAESIYLLDCNDDAKRVAETAEVPERYNAYYESPIFDREWIGKLEVVKIIAQF